MGNGSEQASEPLEGRYIENEAEEDFFPEDVYEQYFPLTDMERDLVERVVAAEGRGESIEAQMAIAQTISQDFMTIYAVIIAFYFGTQSQKVQDAVEAKEENNGTIDA